MSSAPTPRAANGDPVAIDSSHYSVEFENERVRVIRVNYGPGEKSVMHSHPSLIAIMLTDSTIRMSYPDGTSEVIEGKAGQVMQMPAVDHLPENAGTQTFQAILVELKD
jgi:quercetin dioxygenase-like cupin family protein